ncbi:hypothetical protein SPRG_16085 [Saprolegnia parasitica CBS 223.65]|uniref:Uncharacterized protein n=1 Tax=Saprolegnia parasitica (strain CBS 223.65) TaxID=695850 RepID=A0A067BP42_SAPPC|nr:hypothetical protein SPRG_16085 [Saprolegnia parasitica CBS 223.65]KDO18530.1 hypothetical protein SPRG_16085 [Saprolegnia parasitica CBS 223.65]|eukprot:XP_012210765.1 hypothetical protein SPRG_16085 [Saprolegnia parasitica CBS 223.65]
MAPFFARSAPNASPRFKARRVPGKEMRFARCRSATSTRSKRARARRARPAPSDTAPAVAQAHGIPNDRSDKLPKVPHAFPNTAPAPATPRAMANAKALRSRAAPAPATKAHKKVWASLAPAVGPFDAPAPYAGIAMGKPLGLSVHEDAFTCN